LLRSPSLPSAVVVAPAAVQAEVQVVALEAQGEALREVQEAQAAVPPEVPREVRLEPQPALRQVQ
jgi:hypothetical protein